MKNTFILFILSLVIGLCYCQTSVAQILDENGNELYPQKKRKKVKNKKQKGRKGGVLQNPNGFEMYGEEVEEETPELDWGETMPEEKSKTQNSLGKAAKNLLGTKDKSKKGKDGNRIKNKAADKGDVISVDLDALYGTYTPAKTSKSSIEAKEMDFKTREDIKYFYNQAMLKVRAKDYESAVGFLDKCIDKHPKDKELLQLRANSYTELEKFKKAIKDYTQIIKLDREDPVVFYNMGITYTKMGKFKNAVNSFDRSLMLKPSYLLALQGNASAKTMDGKFNQAIEDYNKVLDQNAFFTPAFKGRGVAKSLLGRYDEAISDFSYVIELQPNDGMAHYYRGLAYVGNNQTHRGCADFDRAYQLNIPQAFYELQESCR